MDALHAELVEAKSTWRLFTATDMARPHLLMGQEEAKDKTPILLLFPIMGWWDWIFGSRKAAEAQVLCISKVIAHQKNCSIPVKFVRYHIKHFMLHCRYTLLARVLLLIQCLGRIKCLIKRTRSDKIPQWTGSIVDLLWRVSIDPAN